VVVTEVGARGEGLVEKVGPSGQKVKGIKFESREILTGWSGAFLRGGS